MMSSLNVSVNRRVPQFPSEFQYTSGHNNNANSGSSASTGQGWCDAMF